MEPDEEADEGDLEFESHELPGDQIVDENDVGLNNVMEEEILAGQDDDSPLGNEESAAGPPAVESADSHPDSSTPAAESASPVAPEDAALRRERRDHPMRFSPTTGARAPAGTGAVAIAHYGGTFS